LSVTLSLVETENLGKNELNEGTLGTAVVHLSLPSLDRLYHTTNECVIGSMPEERVATALVPQVTLRRFNLSELVLMVLRRAQSVVNWNHKTGRDSVDISQVDQRRKIVSFGSRVERDELLEALRHDSLTEEQETGDRRAILILTVLALVFLIRAVSERFCATVILLLEDVFAVVSPLLEICSSSWVVFTTKDCINAGSDGDESVDALRKPVLHGG